MPMNVLGITGPISWNNAAALIKDGKLVAAVEEERFTRHKFAPRVLPKNAIKYCLKAGNITLNDVDKIAVGFDTPEAFMRKGYGIYLKHLRFYPFIKKNNYVGDPLEGVDAYFTYKREMMKLKDLFNDKDIFKKVVYIPHHTAHAASTYFASGFQKSNIISLDGRGEDSSTLLAIGNNGKIDDFKEFSVHNSLGNLYSTFTKCLGFNPHSDEGKVMGLACYGKPTYDLKNIVKLTEEGYEFSRNWHYEVTKLFGSNLRRKGDPLTKEHENLAASLQHTLEKAAVHLATVMHEKTGYKSFCLAGGVSLNCDMNSKILFKDFADDIFIQPAAHDAGSALGAAMYVSSKLGDKPYFKMEHAYLGPEYTNDDIKEALNECKLKADFYKDIEGITAEKLAKGYIVGWHQGRIEFGPRALGARSILGHPGKRGMKEKINKEVKHRERWRPFAPSMLAESMPEYVEDPYDSPFMILTFNVKEEKRKEILEATHVDNTVRVQTVKKEINPRYYKLIKEFEKQTSTPVLLNTSFNDNNEPIVLTPRDAIRTFMVSGMDYLAIGNYLLKKSLK